MWVVAAALAQTPEQEVAEEITVWGQRIEAARAEVEASIVDLGYDRVKDRDGRTVFRGPENWKGKVVLTDEGLLQVRRTGPRGKELPPIGGTRIRPYPLCVVAPTACLSMGAWAVSDLRWAQVENRVVDHTAAPLVRLNDAMADAALAERMEELPDQLDRQWAEGISLLGGPPLPTLAERRAELLEFWDTRTETAWGQEVRDAVAAFVRGVVQASEAPFTPEEMATFEARRRSARAFPWAPPGDLQ